VSPHAAACVICGNDVAIEIRIALVEWREPVGKEIWSTIPRCVDVAACRARCEAIGEPWPIADGTPASVLTLPDEEPETPVAPSAEEEAIPWLA